MDLLAELLGLDDFLGGDDGLNFFERVLLSLLFEDGGFFV